ncbi:fimbrillin family protein [Bacteroides sp. OttesenSCG-928-E20]|nr:fimbrillin family protein [Bacteroides sp. OttesenSCG-928-N06]MDL2299459.1 fimbrillin family protein [Bacteroides sp. OttesenSCG-928-E20]MDL2306313.1 fimbrillin family protein [Bacteroides sp. OttesenSCG-928-D19]
MRAYTHRLFILFAGLFALLVTACQSDALPEMQEEVQLQVILGDEETATRVNVSGTEFETGNTFQFFFNSDKPVSTGANLKTASYSYNGTTKKWTPNPAIYWDDYATVERTFCAFLPYDVNNVNQTAYTFNVEANQSVEANYKASDLLIARVQTDRRLIPLKFWHVLSKVVVNVTASTDDSKPDTYFNPDDFAGMEASLVAIKPEATVAYNALTTIASNETAFNPTVTTTAGGTESNIQMLCTTLPTNNTGTKKITATYTAVIPPQTIVAKTRSLTFTLTLPDGTTKKQYHFKHNADIEFPQSKELTINVTLYKNKVVAGNVTIEPWGTIAAKDDTPIVLPK